MSDSQQQQQQRGNAMRRIPLSLESYEHPSLPLVAKRLINFFAEKQPDDARTTAALVSTPGLVPWMTFGTGPILAMNDDMPGRIYIMSGTRAFRFSVLPDAVIVVDDLGDIGATSSFVTIAAGVNAVVFCVPPNAYTSDHNPGSSLNPIGGDVFPGAASVCYSDGYFAFSMPGNTSQWFISRLLDPSSFDALDFAFSDTVPNVVRRVVGLRNQIWTIGENGFQIWYDAGTSGLETTSGISYFPFRNASGGFVPIGTISPQSVCWADNSLWWLGTDGVVYRSDGYSPRRVSTHAIEAILRNGIFGLQALTHPYSGHWFYCLTTVDNRTLCYDIATGAWHERSTSTDGSLPWQAATAAVDHNSIHVFGDRYSGQVWLLHMGPDDAGVNVLRQATLPPLWAGTARAFCARVEIEMQCGGPDTPGPVVLEWSDDGARTWGPWRDMSAGAPADLRHRVYTTRLGSFRQRTFRIHTFGLTRIYAVDADIQGGAW